MTTGFSAVVWGKTIPAKYSAVLSNNEDVAPGVLVGVVPEVLVGAVPVLVGVVLTALVGVVLESFVGAVGSQITVSAVDDEEAVLDEALEALASVAFDEAASFGAVLDVDTAKG